MLERRILTWLAVAMAATAAAVPVAAQQQQPASHEEKGAPAREAGTTSAEARAEFMSGVNDVYNIFFERATQHFDKALQIDPRYGLARVIRANFAPGITPEEQKAQFEQAVADAAGASNQEVLNILAWRAQANAEARPLLQALVTIDPKNPRYAYRLANAQDGSAARIAALQKVGTDFPDFAPTHNTLAYLLWDAGDHDGAMREVQTYVKLAPDHPNSHDSYAELLQRGGHYQEALEHYGEAIAKAADFAESYAGRAEVYQLMGKPAEARAAWKDAIAHEQTADQAQHHVAIAGSYLLDGNRKAAMASIGDAMTVAPAAQRSFGHAFMAIIAGSGGDRAAAKQHQSQIGEGVPPLWRGLAAIYSGDLEGARGIADAAAKGGEDAGCPCQHVIKSILASTSGDIATAEQELKAAENNQGTPLAKAYLAEALAKAGRKAEAQTLRDQVKAADVDFLGDVALLKVRKL